MTTSKIGYRQIPHDFADTFRRVGWDGIEAECRAHKTTIKRWMIALGEEALIRSRREYLEAEYAKTGRRIAGARPGRKLGTAGRYVMGMTRTAVNTTGIEE